MIQGRKNEQKKGANPDFSFFLWGIGSYMLLFRLAKSDGVEQSHKCPNSNDATFLIFAQINSSSIKRQLAV